MRWCPFEFVTGLTSCLDRDSRPDFGLLLMLLLLLLMLLPLLLLVSRELLALFSWELLLSFLVREVRDSLWLASSGAVKAGDWDLRGEAGGEIAAACRYFPPPPPVRFSLLGLGGSPELDFL